MTKRCRSSCLANYFTDNSTMRCVTQCPPYPNYFADILTTSPTFGRCVKYCPPNTYASNSSRVCASQCPNGTYAENSTWRCVDYCLNSPLTYRDPSVWKCVSKCSPQYFVDYHNLLCVLACPPEGDGFATLDTR